MKNHYQLLGVGQTAPSDEIKRAFRREIARYHPDKVQHLGPEFQEIAATRAAELTEAYRVLMDTDSRRTYDDQLEHGAEVETVQPAPASRARAAAAAGPAVEWPRPRSEPAPPPTSRVERAYQQDRAATSDFVRRAAMVRLRDALTQLAVSAVPMTIPGFDAAYLIRPRKILFKKADAQVRLLARFVPQVDGAAVADAWPLAARSGTFDGVVCLMLLGTGVSPIHELGAAVAEQRRKTRTAAPVVVPVDVRDWEALFPPEAPDIVRQVVQRLKAGA